MSFAPTIIWKEVMQVKIAVIVLFEWKKFKNNSWNDLCMCFLSSNQSNILHKNRDTIGIHGIWPWAQVKYQYSASSERKKADIEDEVGMMNPRMLHFTDWSKSSAAVVHMTLISLGTPVFRIIILQLNWMHWRDYDFCLPSCLWITRVRGCGCTV